MITLQLALESLMFMIEDLNPPQRSLRMALVTESYPPEVNGVATTVAQVVSGLRARSHQLQLVRPRQANPAVGTEDLDQEVLMRGMNVPRYPHLKMGLPCRRALISHWTRRRPDLVHIATEGPLGWSALQAASHLRIPVTSDFRTNFQEYSRHYGIGWLSRPILSYLRKFHNRTACTMVPTEALRQQLQSLGFERVQVVARGVDAARFHPRHRDDGLRASWGASETSLVVMCVGRLAPEKNLDLLFDAFDAMKAVRRDMKLVLVGDGPMRKSLERRHPDVILAGQQTGAALAAHYASADLFVLPSVTETFGNVTPEAMASGLPIVAFDYAAASQFVEPGQNGWLAPLGAPDVLVRQACSAAEDLPRLRAMGLRARQTASDRHWDRIIEQIEGVMHQALAPRPDAPVASSGVLHVG